MGHRDASGAAYRAVSKVCQVRGVASERHALGGETGQGEIMKGSIPAAAQNLNSCARMETFNFEGEFFHKGLNQSVAFESSPEIQQALCQRAEDVLGIVAGELSYVPAGSRKPTGGLV